MPTLRVYVVTIFVYGSQFRLDDRLPPGNGDVRILTRRTGHHVHLCQ